MTKRLLLIGWDGADWSLLHPLIDSGKMPALRRIVEAGASGALLCGQPPIAAAQWTSIVTGKRPWQHGICHPLEAFTDKGDPIPVAAGGRRALTLWEMLASKGKRSLVVGWPATHGDGTRNSRIVSDRYSEPTAGPGVRPWPPAAPGSYSPETLGRRLDKLRMSPEDIQGDIVSHYIPDWIKVDQKRDQHIGRLRVYLAADLSHQAAMLDLLSRSDWDFAAVRFPALGAISALFLPYRPPKPDWIPSEEFDLYQNVIPAACGALDRFLHLLVQAAGKDTAILVVSAHGVSRQPVPPKLPASQSEAWKSPHGIFAACGPGFAADSLVFGATVVDVAPTVLTWFGLPIGEDMEGRVLLEGFATPPEVGRVASWETEKQVRTPSAPGPEGRLENNSAAAALRREYDWNFAQFCLDAARYEEALPVLERLFRAFPERSELGHALFNCQLTLQQLTEAGETLEVVLAGLPPGIWSLLPRAELEAARGQAQEARSLVDQALALNPAHPIALRRLGMLLLRLRQWDALADLAKAALKLDDTEPLAWLGLAEAQLRKRLPAEAEEAALRAIGLNYYLPQAHFVLARALIAQGKWQQAQESMRTLLQLQPDNRAASAYSKRLEQPPRPTPERPRQD